MEKENMVSDFMDSVSDKSTGKNKDYEK